MNNPSPISVQLKDHVATIRFGLMTAATMTATVVNGLYDTLQSLRSQPGIRAVIVTGEHPGPLHLPTIPLPRFIVWAAPTLALKPWLRGAFPLAIRATMALARHWIRWDRKAPHESRTDRWLRDTPFEGALLYARANRLIQTLRHYPLPVIAAIDGDAQGYGMELALACDFRAHDPGDLPNGPDRNPGGADPWLWWHSSSGQAGGPRQRNETLPAGESAWMRTVPVRPD